MTLIEVLVVVVVIGILAAIALPSFLGHKSKAADAAAKTVARTAQATAETYAAERAGSYAGLEAKVLRELEPTIQTAAGKNNAYLSAAKAIESSRGFEVTATSTTAGHTFTVKRAAAGQVTRTCTPAGKTGAAGGGCQNSRW